MKLHIWWWVLGAKMYTVLQLLGAKVLRSYYLAPYLCTTMPTGITTDVDRTGTCLTAARLLEVTTTRTRWTTGPGTLSPGTPGTSGTSWWRSTATSRTYSSPPPTLPWTVY